MELSSAKIFHGRRRGPVPGIHDCVHFRHEPHEERYGHCHILPIFVLALPILDTALAILRRLKNGRPIMEADKGHLHHRIMNVGMGQKRTVLTLYCISGIMGVAAILISRDLFIDALLLIAIAVTLIYVFMKDQGFGKPFNGKAGKMAVADEVTNEAAENDGRDKTEEVGEKE